MRGLADFHEAIDREMKRMLEKCGLDDSITRRRRAILPGVRL